jgi:lipopolysaccharide/colanic/teichoic acid biosynthesis glycosyltransferase
VSVAVPSQSSDSRQMALMPARDGSRREREWQLLRGALVAVDTAALVLALGAASLLRLWLEEFLDVWPLMIQRQAVVSVLLVPILLFIFRLQSLYDFDHILAGTREYARIAHAVTYSVLITVLASYFFYGEPFISRLWLLLVSVLSIGFVSLGRFAARRAVRRLRRRGALRTRVVIVGASTFGIAIAKQLIAARGEGLDVVAFLDEYVPRGERLLGDIAVVGRPGDLVQCLEADLADEYILVPQALPHERLEEFTRLVVAHGRPILRLAVSSTDLLTNGLLVAERGNVPLVTLQRAGIVGLDALIKRGFDLASATLMAMLLTPLVLVALLRAYVAGIRPIFDRQWIHGLDGAQLMLWVLNSRVSTSLPVRGAPALLAVLRGQLSLVGPRPVVGSGAPPGRVMSCLTAVKPGLTGPWRLSGSETSLADQAMLDLAYIRNYSIWEDARIILQSVRRVSHGRGSQPLGRWEDSKVALAFPWFDMPDVPGAPT